MNRRQIALAALPLLLAATGARASADTSTKLSIESRTQLQAAMQSHIDRISIGGVFPYVDLKTGQVRKLHPAAGHPMMLRLGDHFVLCADFRDEAGKAVNIDFYVARAERRFQVFQMEVANRAPLETLVKAGVARMLD